MNVVVTTLEFQNIKLYKILSFFLQSTRTQRTIQNSDILLVELYSL